MIQSSRRDQKLQSETETKILEAAGAVFVEHGFRDATVRAICKRAGANLAAINYYFGDKESLYLAVIKHWSTAAFEQYPPDMGIQPADPPEKRLRAFVRATILRMLDEGPSSWFGKLMAREFTKPTHALDQFIEETIRPTFKFLSSIVRGLLGKNHDEETIRRCCTSIVGQCFFFYSARPIIARLFKQDSFSANEKERIAEHITQFSLSALKMLSKSSKGGK